VCGVNEDDETEVKHNVEVDESKRRKQQRDERVAKGSVFSFGRILGSVSTVVVRIRYCYLPAYSIECGHCSKISGPRICVECIVDHYLFIDPLRQTIVAVPLLVFVPCALIALFVPLVVCRSQ
jgi:hypothetical protein